MVEAGRGRAKSRVCLVFGLLALRPTNLHKKLLNNGFFVLYILDWTPNHKRFRPIEKFDKQVAGDASSLPGCFTD
jgi:hypothetical protein